MRTRPFRMVALASSLALLGGSTRGQDQPDAPKDEQPPAPPAAAKLPGPPPIPEVKLVPELPTHPVRRGALGPNWIKIDSSPLPRDREGIWVLDFAFKPLRMVEVEMPDRRRRRVHYLYYRVINHTGKPRRFVPQFTLVTDRGKRYEEAVLPTAVKVIGAREDPTIKLLGASAIFGVIPNSDKEGIDDVVDGVAIWDSVDFAADRFKIFIRGLSDGYQEVKPPGDAKPYTRYKALRIDFVRFGDERDPNEREIRLADPPYEWVYYP